jgi:hypothetical protein
MMISTYLRALAVLAAIGLSSLTAGSVEYAGQLPAISEENYIATPGESDVSILLDLFPFEGEIATTPDDQRPALAEGLTRQVVELYLKELEPADAKALTSAEVMLVYVRERDEYDKPRFSAMVEIGLLKATIAGGKIEQITPAPTLAF